MSSKPRGSRASRHIFAFGALATASFAVTVALANPRVPSDPAQVLERVPAAAATQELEPLRRRLQSEPQNLSVALDLAQGYLSIGRETSDPRFISYAQATLAPWARAVDPPVAVMVLSATALQSTHRFDDALALLDRALAVDPRNAQAWLTKATLLQVQGRLAPARAACMRLVRIADPLVALACVASVDGSNGKLSESYSKLQRFFSIDRRADGEIRAWVLGLLGEMALRLGDVAAAETHIREARRALPEDVYSKAAYADLLLAAGRNREVLELLEGGESHDTLLLRLAIAGRRAGSERATQWAQLFEARRRAARADDNTHLREHARFLLEVRDAPSQALEVARQNWAVQREAADIRIYLQAASAAGRPEAAAVVQAWVRETGYEDRTLGRALIRSGRPRS